MIRTSLFPRLANVNMIEQGLFSPSHLTWRQWHLIIQYTATYRACPILVGTIDEASYRPGDGLSRPRRLLHVSESLHTYDSSLSLPNVC